MIQLPNDAKQVGLQRNAINKFEFDAIYASAEKQFTGTEREFVTAGHAYAYVQLDKFTRRTIVLA